MSIQQHFITGLLCTTLLLGLTTTQAAETKVRELEWEELIPAEWMPDSELVFKYNNGEIGDEDPRIVALKKKMAQLEKLAPVNETLNGLRVKIPGFVVPLEGDGSKVTEFLLVPYHGACVHVPPPPPNQLIHVRSKPTTRKLMETVSVTGTMKVIKTKNKIAETGYTLHADRIEAYE